MVGLKSAFYETFKFILTLYFCEPLLIIVEENRSITNINPICHGVFLTFVVAGGGGAESPPSPPPSVLLVDKW